MQSFKNTSGDLSLYSPGCSGVSMPLSFSNTDINLPVKSAEMTEFSFRLNHSVDEDLLNVSHLEMSGSRKINFLLSHGYSRKEDLLNWHQPAQHLSPERQTDCALPPCTEPEPPKNDHIDVTIVNKMNKTRRKKYKQLIMHGYSEKEAILKSVCPRSVIIRLISKKRSGGNSQKVNRNPTSNFLPNKENKKINKSCSSPNSIMEKEICVQIGIFPAAFPNVKFHKEQFEALQDCLSEHILKDTVSMPQFRGTTCKDGWLQITCANIVTVEWLKKIVSSLKPWRNAKLNLLEEKDFPKPMNLVCFLPKSSTISDDCILDYLKKQNPKNLDIRLWKILYREDSSDMTKAIISIDDGSAFLLTKDGAKLYYMLGSVNFMVINAQLEGPGNIANLKNYTGKPRKQPKRENVAGPSRNTSACSWYPSNNNNYESRLENKLLHILDGPKINSNDYLIPDTKERFERDLDRHNYESSLRNVEQEIILLEDQLRCERRALELELKREIKYSQPYSPRKRSRSPRRHYDDDRDMDREGNRKVSNSLTMFLRKY